MPLLKQKVQLYVVYHHRILWALFTFGYFICLNVLGEDCVLLTCVYAHVYRWYVLCRKYKDRNMNAPFCSIISHFVVKSNVSLAWQWENVFRQMTNVNQWIETLLVCSSLYIWSLLVGVLFNSSRTEKRTSILEDNDNVSNTCLNEHCLHSLKAEVTPIQLKINNLKTKGKKKAT